MVRQYRPSDDDRRRAACACFLFAAVCACDLWLRPAGVTRAEFGGGVGGVIVGVLSGLAGLFGGGGKVDGTTLKILIGLRDALTAVGTSFTGYAYETNGKLGRIAGILSRLWDAVLLPFIKKTDGKIRGVYDWLKATLGPVIEALKWLRKHVLDIYDKYFRPILDTIDAIRGVLRVLSLLHVKVAAKLDAQLAALEHRLLQPIRIALEAINTVTDWVNKIITVDGLFQRYTLLRSLIVHERDVWAVWSASLHHREVEHPPTPGEWPRARTSADVARVMTDYFDGKDSPEKAHIDELGQDLVLELTRASSFSL